MSKHDYYQTHCGCCSPGHIYVTFADLKEFEEPCDGCEEMRKVKNYDEADKPEYFIGVAESELEDHNYHSRTHEPQAEYDERTKQVTDEAEKLRIAKEICERICRWG